MFADLLAIGAGASAAYWLRFHAHLIPVLHGYDPRSYIKILPYLSIVWLAALRFENLYRRRSRVFDFNVMRRIVTGSCLALLILIALNFYQQVGEFSRVASLIMLVCIVGALILNRLVLHFVFQWMMLNHGIGQSRTVILGGGPIAGQIYESLVRHPERGMNPIGLILGNQGNWGNSGKDELQSTAEMPILGTVEQLEALLGQHRVDEVILTQTELDHEQIPQLLVICERAMAVFRIVPDTTELLLSGMTVETIEGIPLLGIRETPLQGWNAALKRLIDCCVALSGLLLLSPIIAVVSWLIWRQDRQSPFYRQERMGIDGRLFKIIKFRSMRPDAEVGSGPVFAVDYDPRCTPLGMFLRRSHLDEIPQLFNVLCGEMSLVGPRPERPFFIQKFRDSVPQYMARHRVRSGITGWAQVNGLCGLHGSIPERLKYDLYYIENWTLWLDFKILLLTVFGRIRAGSV